MNELLEAKALKEFEKEISFCVLSELFRIRDSIRLILGCVNTPILKEFLLTVNQEIDKRID